MEELSLRGELEQINVKIKAYEKLSDERELEEILDELYTKRAKILNQMRSEGFL